MAAPQNFRTAFNGFNRDDVVQFLEYITNKHQAQMDTIRDENNHLRTLLEAQPQEDSAAAQELEQTRQELIGKQAQCDDLAQQLSAAQGRLQELESAPPVQADTSALDARIEDLNTELMLSHSRIQELEEQAERDVQDAQDAAQELEQARQELVRKQAQCDELTQQLSAAQGRLSELESAPPVQADTSALDAQIEDLNTELMLSHSRIQELEGQAQRGAQDLQDAQEKTHALEQQLSQAQSRIQELEGQAQRGAQDLQDAQEKARTLEQQLSQAQSKLQELERKLSASQTGAMDVYRRSAENERFVRAQSELVYHQANGVLGQAQLQVNVASQELTAATEETMKQLAQLQMAVAQSRRALEDAAALMQAIRPVRGNS